MVLSRSLRKKKPSGSDDAARKYRVSSPHGGSPRSSRPPSGRGAARDAATAGRGGGRSSSSSRGGSGAADDAAAAELAKKLRRIMMGVTAPDEAGTARPVPCVEQLVARRFTLSPEGPAHARLMRQAARDLGPDAFAAAPPGGGAPPAPLLSSLTPAAAARAAKSATRAQAEALREAAAASCLRPDATVPTPAPFSYALKGRRRRRRGSDSEDDDDDDYDDESAESSDTSTASTASGSQGPPPPPPVHPHYAALVKAFGLSEELFRAMPPEQLWAYQRRLYVKRKLRAIRSSSPTQSPPSPPPEATTATTEGDGRRSAQDMQQLAEMLAAQPQGLGGRAGKRRLPLDFFYLRKHARRRAKERVAAAAAAAAAAKARETGGEVEEEPQQQQAPLLDLLTLTPRDPANPSQRLPYSQWDDERYGLAVARKKVLQSVERARRAGTLPAHKYDAAVAAGLLKLRGGNGWLAPTPAAAFAQMPPAQPAQPAQPQPVPAAEAAEAGAAGAASQQEPVSETTGEMSSSSSSLHPQASVRSVKAAAAGSQAKPGAARGQPPRPGSAPATRRPPKGRVAAAAAAAAAASQQQGCSDDESLSNSADGSDHEAPAKRASRGRGNGTRGGAGGGGGDVGERVACACGHVVRVPAGTAAAAEAAASAAASSAGADDGGEGASSRTSPAYQLPASRATKVSYAYDNVFLLVGVNKRLYMLAGGRGTAPAAPAPAPAATGGGGGSGGAAPAPAVSLWELDVAKDKPARLLPVPAAFCDAQCITAHNERFFVVCGAAYGLCGDGTVWEYNTTSKAARPVHTISSRFPFGSLMCVVLETLHILCGRLGSAQAAKGHEPSAAAAAAEANGKPACGCGSLFSISLETKGHERMLTADAGLLGNAQAMAGVSCNGAAKLYILLGSDGGLCGDGSLIEYDVAQQVRRVVLPPGSLPYGRMLCAVSSTRLVALCGATGHLCDIDLAQSRALLQQSQHRRQQQQQQAPTATAASGDPPPPPAPAPLPLRLRPVADVETRQAQAMAAVGGRIFAVHGDPATNYDAGLWEYSAPPLPKRVAVAAAAASGVVGAPPAGAAAASSAAGSAAGSEAGSVLCMTFDDYCAAEAAYTKHATERLSLEQLRAASAELLARLKAGTTKQELSVLVERERSRAGPHDLQSLLRVVYHRLPVSEVRRAVAAHEAEKRRRDKDGWGGSWRSQTSPGAAAELERLFAHLGGACDGGGRVVPRVAMETLPATAVLTRADVEDVLGGATGRGLTLDQLAVLFLDTDASAAQEVRPTLFFQSDVPHSSSATASDVLGGKLNKLLESEAFSGVAA